MRTLKIFGVILLLAAIGLAGYFGWAKYIHPSENTKVAAGKADTNIAYYHCGMHPQIISDKPGKCPICGMNLTPVYKTNANNHDGIITIDPVMVQNIGVKTEKVMRHKLTHTIRATGIVDYDEEKQTVITTKFSGYIEKLYVDYTGKSVEKGQPLFEIYSPDLVAAQQEYLQAIHYGKTMKQANDSSVSAGAGDLVQSSRKKLMYWDISEEQIKELERTGIVKKTLTIYSPFSGVVIEKDIYEGIQVQAGMNLLKLADISQMWVYADIYENELVWVKEGENATISLPSTPGKTIEAKVSYIYPFLQDQTRTAKVRIAFTNDRQLLKKDMYVTVNIIPTVSIDAVAIPEQSVIHSGSRNIVVMSLGEGKFMSMDVTLGVLADGYYQVLKGINEGDIIVTSSQFLIDSESNLKAGTSSMQGMNMEGMEMSSKNEKKDDNMHNMNDSAMRNTKIK